MSKSAHDTKAEEKHVSIVPAAAAADVLSPSGVNKQVKSILSTQALHGGVFLNKSGIIRPKEVTDKVCGQYGYSRSEKETDHIKHAARNDGIVKALATYVDELTGRVKKETDREKKKELKAASASCPPPTIRARHVSSCNTHHCHGWYVFFLLRNFDSFFVVHPSHPRVSYVNDAPFLICACISTLRLCPCAVLVRLWMLKVRLDEDAVGTRDAADYSYVYYAAFPCKLN
jgi:hypothetical protein